MQKPYFDEGLEAFVFGQQVFVEVHRLIVPAAKSPINPLHSLAVGSRELERNWAGVTIKK